MFVLILFGIAGFDIGYRSVESFEIIMFDMALFLVGGYSLLETVLRQVEYRAELKQYILEQTK